METLFGEYLVARYLVMKKVIKYFFMIVASLIAIATILYGVFILFIAMMFSGGSEAEKRQDELGHTAQKQIVMFYNNHGYYPKSLHDLPLYKDKDFATLLQKNNIFRYSSYGADEKSKYIFSWRGGAMNWTGYRCTNDKSKISQEQYSVVRTYEMPDGTVCTVTDLH